MSTKHNEPLLVQIPETGQFINVRPFLNFILSDFNDPVLGLKSAAEDIEKRIRFIACDLSFSQNMQETSNIYQLFNNLYELKDLFTQTNILNKEA